MLDMANEYVHMATMGRQNHDRYVQDAENYRRMAAGRNRESNDSLRILERVGTRFIELGRRLCERRGTVVVDVAFHKPNRSGNGHAA